MRYSFCESVTGIGPWHIRVLTDKGQKLGGGIDTAALCNLVLPAGQVDSSTGRRGGGGWDISVVIDEHHLGHACHKCVAEYRKAVARDGH